MGWMITEDYDGKGRYMGTSYSADSKEDLEEMRRFYALRYELDWEGMARQLKVLK